MPVASLPDDDDRDRNRAKVFFARARSVADAGNFEYAIEMFIQGLKIDPENIPAHQELREISLKRKASGGRDMGMMDRMKLPKVGGDIQTMLNAEKLLAYDPADNLRLLALLTTAKAAGMTRTAAWIWTILNRASDR